MPNGKSKCWVCDEAKKGSCGRGLCGLANWEAERETKWKMKT